MSTFVIADSHFGLNNIYKISQIHIPYKYSTIEGFSITILIFVEGFLLAHMGKNADLSPLKSNQNFETGNPLTL